jgi:hypothetical protein
VSEKIQYLVTSVGSLPDFKTLYHYRADGNVIKKELFQYVNNDWFKTEDIITEEYDQYINASERFESYPYLPAGMFPPNNPIKETWIDKDGTTTQTAYHAYTYDVNARPLTEKPPISLQAFQILFGPEDRILINIILSITRQSTLSLCLCVRNKFVHRGTGARFCVVGVGLRKRFDYVFLEILVTFISNTNQKHNLIP